MNRCVGGKPRAGKTKRAVIWVIEQLRSHRRPIVTNMALKLEPWVDGAGKPQKGLLRTLQDRYGETFDAERRIYLLTHEEVRRFYAVRPMVSKEDESTREIATVPRSDMWKFDANRYPGCCFVIDEAEVYFPSQAVDSTSAAHEDREVLQWAKQAGRGGDDALFLSQNLVWISKKLRGTCQECWWMVNHVHVSFGMFRRPDRITEESYVNCPPNPGEERMRMSRLYYSKEEIEGCYNTAEGVGVTGNSAADIGQKARGLHWGFIPVGIVGIAILALLGLWGFKGLVQAGFRGQQASARAAASGGVGTNGSMMEVKSDGFTDRQRETLFAVFGKMTNRLTALVPVYSSNSVAKHPAYKEPEEGVVGMVRGLLGTVVCFSDGSSVLAKSVEPFGKEIAVDGVIYKRVSGQAGRDKDKKSKVD